jgi:teichuronic acid biosynthesis glycosyltransferase TuaH
VKSQSDLRLRIVYIMNVDWDWAKQRPHFLAEHLSKSFDLIIFYPYSWRRAHVAKNERYDLKLYPFFRLPFGGKFEFIQRLNSSILRIMASIFIKMHPSDFVWISSAELFDYLPKHLSTFLIYDCMDDILAFPSNKTRKDMLSANENALVKICTHVFCSSANLHDRLISRAGYASKYSVIHNALEPSALLNFTENANFERSTNRYVLGYVGTISSWLDFEALLKIVDTFPSIEIHLLGPIENLGGSRPNHDRIKFMGPVCHGKIASRVSDFDILLMPFKVTELILSVDPVKLYEYVFFDKPIVSVWYPEINKFSNYVNFYTNHEELISILSRFVSCGVVKKYSLEARNLFVEENTWAQRVACIEDTLFQIKVNSSVS